MRLDAKKLALTLGITTLGAWILCSAVVAIAPAMTMTITEHMFHLSDGAFTWNLTLQGVLIGAFFWSVLVGLFTWAAAGIYNAMLGEATVTSRTPERA